MIPGMENSFTGVGHLRDEINSKLIYKADKHEVDTLRNEVSSLRSQIERLQNQVSGLCQREVNY